MPESFTGQWIKLFNGLDLTVLTMLGVIAFALERARKVSDTQTIIVLLIAGAVWGVIDALRTWGPEQPLGLFVAFVAKGILMNSGGAYLLSQGIHAALRKTMVDKEG
jgi:hypothetical protein